MTRRAPRCWRQEDHLHPTGSIAGGPATRAMKPATSFLFFAAARTHLSLERQVDAIPVPNRDVACFAQFSGCGAQELILESLWQGCGCGAKMSFLLTTTLSETTAHAASPNFFRLLRKDEPALQGGSVRTASASHFDDPRDQSIFA